MGLSGGMGSPGLVSGSPTPTPTTYPPPPGKKKPPSSPSLGSLQQREGAKAEVGDQVLVAGQKQGVVRFYGKTDFAPGEDEDLGYGAGRA